jgi:cytochrome c biogenesis protein CcmG/thiol:disulfide interchange protein DsbE
MEVEEQPSEGVSSGEILTEQFLSGSKKRNRMQRIIVFIAAILLNAGLLALLGSELLTPAQDQSHAGSAQSSSGPLIKHPAPDFTLAALSARRAPAIHLASLKGKLVMLNFWASWCDPCKQEAPLLEATWQRVRSQGIVFLGIDFEDRQSDGLSFLQTYGITYPNVIDASGSVAINYGVTGVPETFFIDRHGVIVSKVIGELTAQTLQSNLQLIAR